MKWPARPRLQGSAFCNEAILEQTCCIGIHVQPIAESLREPAVEIGFVPADQSEQLLVVLLARQRPLHEVACTRLQLERRLRVMIRRHSATPQQGWSSQLR
jgi:hypothetical protein